jgi:hypothetical protein
MKTAMLVAAAALFAATSVSAQNAKGQLNQANQSGRIFDGSKDGRGGSTLDGKDAVVKPDNKPAARPSTSNSRSTPSSSSSSRPSSSSSSSSRRRN